MRKLGLKTPKAKATKPLVRLYLADDFRSEIDGKVTAVGLYTDLVVVANMQPGTPPPSPEKPLVIHSLSAMITVAGLEGMHLVSFEYVDETLPKASKGGEPKEVDFAGKLTAGNLVVKFQPFVAGGFGKKRIVVKIDDESSNFEFEIRQGTARASQGSSSRRSVTSPKKLVEAVATRKPARKAQREQSSR